MGKKAAKIRMLFLYLIIFLLFPVFTQAQLHFYAGQGFGSYLYYQGPLETHAFVFNNSTSLNKEMKPNRSFSGTSIGSCLNMGRFVVGIDWAGKKNWFKGEKEENGSSVTDKMRESLNTLYINFGVGNKAVSGQKLVWRIQTAFGFYSFKLKEELKGTSDDFDGVLGKTRGISCRSGVNIWYPIYKKWKINLLPYYEFDTTGGYVEILEDRIQNSEYFNINNYGLIINLDYEF